MAVQKGKTEERKADIARYRAILMALIVIAVVLAAAITAIYALYGEKSPAVEEGSKSPSSSHSQTSQSREPIEPEIQPEQPEADSQRSAERGDPIQMSAQATLPTGEAATEPEVIKMAIEAQNSVNKAEEPGVGLPVKVVLTILWALLGLDLAGITVCVARLVMLGKGFEKTVETRNMKTCDIPGWPKQAACQNQAALKMGMLQNIGARPYQEDSLGFYPLADGGLAVVADGMGGLIGGDKVSQKIVQTMMAYGTALRSGQMDGVLEAMVRGVNAEVNRMLGSSGIYKSGSTLMAVLVRDRKMHWIAVGDSRIYLYRNGHLTKLNQEHNLGSEVLMKAIRGEMSYEEARATPKKSGVTSFIGMGNLKYVDRSLRSIPLEADDRILLMTDGVFNSLPEQMMEAILRQVPDVQTAANEFERKIIQKAASKQDNFSAIILGI